MKHKLYTFESISQILAEYGFILLDYISTKELISKDNEGYKYKLNLCNLKNGKIPNKYMLNPFALDNFKLYLQKNYPHYHLLDNNYTGCKTKMRFICDLHKEKGIQQNTVANIVHSHHACIYCGCNDLWERKRTTIEQMKKECIRVGVKFVSRTSRNNECMVNYICQNHKDAGIQSTSWTHFKEYRNGCPLCNKISKGEDEIYSYLIKEKIEFIKEYRFADCIHKRKLPFDFYLPKFNIIIEYNGKQHYKPVKIFGGQEKYEETILRDKIKQDYCKNKNIKMIIIPYWDFKDIKTILDNELKCKVQNP
ncbi:MAG: hypothetical protein II304_03575 [Bacteroidales bacterium]|nr:hypothetical protein [Bacteroidales bacterium]